MGYRTYLARVPKKEHDAMQKMSYVYLVEKYNKGDESVSPYHLAKEIHGFGKYYDAPTEGYNHFFADKDMQERFEGDFWVIDKEFLLAIIEQERKAMAGWFEDCKKMTHEELIQQAEREASEWRGDFGCCPYNLDIEKPNLVSSWKRNYVIFDLVRIYKTFDFENDLLIYYGW